MFFFKFLLTLSWWRPLSYRNQSTDLLRKSMEWLLYDNGIRHERVKMGKKWRKMLTPTYSLKFKNIILFLNRALYFFSNDHIRNVVSTLPDVENDNAVSMLSNVVQFNIEKHNVVLRCKFQHWCDFVWRRDVISTWKQRWTDVQMFAGCLPKFDIYQGTGATNCFNSNINS